MRNNFILSSICFFVLFLCAGNVHAQQVNGVPVPVNMEEDISAPSMIDQWDRNTHLFFEATFSHEQLRRPGYFALISTDDSASNQLEFSFFFHDGLIDIQEQGMPCKTSIAQYTSGKKYQFIIEKIRGAIKYHIHSETGDLVTMGNVVHHTKMKKYDVISSHF